MNKLAPLKGYQVIAKDQLICLKRAILPLTRGSGKTRIAYTAADELLNRLSNWEPSPTPILITCSKSSLLTWESEAVKWFPGKYTTVFIKGNKAARMQLWQEIANYDFIICTHEILRRDIKEVPAYWFGIIVDEAHRLRNRNALKFKAFKKLKSDFLFFVTGTPVRKGPQDLWTMLNRINNKVFSSYWRFVNSWCLIADDGFGKEFLGPKNVKNLREMLSRYVVRVDSSIIEKELPDKIRQPLLVEMSPKQAKLYQVLVDESIAELDSADGIMLAPTTLAMITRLRQLLISPRLWSVNIKEYGGGLDTIVDHMEEQEESHVTIFTIAAKALPIIEECLRAKGYENIFILKGGTEPEEVKRIKEEFAATRGIILCTIGFAESFDLETCSTGYMLGPDWNPDTNEQAEDRLRRLSSEAAHINIYYIVYKGTIDDRVYNILNDKKRSSSLTMSVDSVKSLLTHD